MRVYFRRCVIGLLVGITCGMVYPASASVWSLFVLTGILVLNEFAGRWGFGHHWGEYRFSSYILYTGLAACIWVGIQFGSGNVGAFLIFIGKGIS